MADQEMLINEIKSLSDAIRKKNRDLKLGISERHRYLENTFKPVVDPLQEISRKLDKPSPEMDIEDLIPEVEDESDTSVVEQTS
ncbi:hypothetical protein [Klebsiella pneumoniae]|nr:hypothetical protein [Klebsiella pneumoniae]